MASKMLVEITVSEETSKSVPDVAINGPSTCVLDRNTPLDGVKMRVEITVSAETFHGT